MAEQDPFQKLRDVIEKLVGDTLEAKRKNLQDGIAAYEENLQTASNLVAETTSGIQQCEGLIKKILDDPELAKQNPEHIPELQDALRRLNSSLGEAKQNQEEASTKITQFREGIHAIDQMTGKGNIN